MLKFCAMVLALAPAVLLSGAADVPAAEKARKKRDCINAREINVMRPLDDKHVFVKAGANRSYLLTMDPCPGMGGARKLAVFEASPRVCGDGTSLLAFELPETGAMRCRVGKIETVRDLADAEDRIQPEHPRK
jgi:hypothetical protein